MSSLDEVYEQMRLFERALREFDEELHVSSLALRKSDEDLSGQWRDQAAQRYRQVYDPLAQSLDQYLQHGAPRFEAFLESKVRQLEKYLHGG